MEIGRLPASKVVQSLKAQGVTHVIALPDSETRHMYDALVREPSIAMIPIAREGEAICIAAGLWIAGKKPIVMIQNAGLFESGDALRGMGIGVNQPLVMFIGYRGYTRRGDTPDTAAQFPGAVLTPLASRLLRRRGAKTTSTRAHGVRTGAKESQPVGILIGTEYSPG